MRGSLWLELLRFGATVLLIMSKKSFKIFCASIFIFIFSTKMIISVIPLFANPFDSEYINAVIMQIELEDHPKSADSGKEKVEKELWQNVSTFFSFSIPVYHLSINAVPVKDCNHIQSFYPTVPTPPPNV